MAKPRNLTADAILDEYDAANTILRTSKDKDVLAAVTSYKRKVQQAAKAHGVKLKRTRIVNKAPG